MRLKELKQKAKKSIKSLLILVALYVIYMILINNFTSEQLQWAVIIILFLVLSSDIEKINDKLSGIKKEDYLTYNIDYSVKVNELYPNDLFIKKLNIGDYIIKIKEVIGEPYIVISDYFGDQRYIIKLDNLGKLVNILYKKGVVEYYRNENDYISNAIKEKENEIKIQKDYLEQEEDINDEGRKDIQEYIIELEQNIIELRKKMQDIDE
jgi:hypothetical protein